MAPKKSTIVLNVEQFIHDVEQRPAIWNRNFHCNKAFLEQMWDELSDEHKLPKVVLKAKWKGLRDNFRVEYKRIPRLDNGEFRIDPATFESKWIHYYALLFLTEHMRHRMPKHDQDQSFFFNQQSEDCEKTVVEPDLTNGLIRRMRDSDDDFDDDDDDCDQEEMQDCHHQINDTVPPAAHAQPLSNILNCGAIIKTEDARNLLKTFEKDVQDLSKKTADSNKQLLAASSVNCNNVGNDDNNYISSVAGTNATTSTGTLTAFVTPVTSPMSFPSLSLVSSTSSIPSTAAATFVNGNGTVDIDVGVDANCNTISPVTVPATSITRPYQSTIAHAAATAFVTATLASIANNNSSNNSNNNIINNGVQKQIQSQQNITRLPPSSILQPIVSLPPTLPSAMVLPNACMATVTSQKIRSVSPPPLYNKAHHPPPHNPAMLMMSKERADDYPLNASICLHTGNNNSSHHEHFNFTKHSYSNGLISALKLKRPRLSEDSNYNGSSTMDTTTTTTTISTPPLVPEDDDYHYLLSLHPYMKQLTAAQKLRIRTKIQKLIFKELYKEDLEESR